MIFLKLLLSKDRGNSILSIKVLENSKEVSKMKFFFACMVIHLKGQCMEPMLFFSFFDNKEEVHTLKF